MSCSGIVFPLSTLASTLIHLSLHPSFISLLFSILSSLLSFAVSSFHFFPIFHSVLCPFPSSISSSVFFLVVTLQSSISSRNSFYPFLFRSPIFHSLIPLYICFLFSTPSIIHPSFFLNPFSYLSHDFNLVFHVSSLSILSYCALSFSLLLFLPLSCLSL